MELIDLKGELHQILTNKIEDLKIDFNNYYKFDKIDESIIRIKLPKIVKNMLFTTYGVKAVMRKAIVFMDESLVKAIVQINSWKHLDDIENYFRWKSYNNVSIKNAIQFFGQYIKYPIRVNQILDLKVSAYNRTTELGKILSFVEQEDILPEIFENLWEEILQAYGKDININQ
jgi:hypothetical protein